MHYVVPIVTSTVTRGGRELTFRDPKYRHLFGNIVTVTGKTETHMTCIAQAEPGGDPVRAEQHDALVSMPDVTFVDD